MRKLGLLLGLLAAFAPVQAKECKNATPVHDIQGTAEKSPLVGRGVVVHGAVTGDFQNRDADIINTLDGFFVQELTPDEDPSTSEGIFVFDGPKPKTDVKVGDIVCVHGNVKEYYGETQLDIRRISIIGEGASIDPTPVSLPVGTTLNHDEELIADLERYEGMLVTFPEQLVVTSLRELDRFGEIELTARARAFTPTNIALPSVEMAQQAARNRAASTLILDDGITWQNPPAIRYALKANTPGPVKGPRNGDLILGLTGNLRYSRGSTKYGTENWRLEPVQEPRFVLRGGTREQLPEVGGNLRVAAFNAHNFFTEPADRGDICGPLGRQACRGAGDIEELRRQQQKTHYTAAALHADLLGLVELENNETSLPAVARGISDVVGGAGYAFVDTGSVGDDAIKVGILYRPDRLEPVGEYRVLDRSVDERFDSRKSRPVIAQTFRDSRTGETFTFAVLHLKSKSSSCEKSGDPDLGDGQGNCNRTRTLAAQALADWLIGIAESSGDPDILVGGDFNAFTREDPVREMEAAGFVNLVPRFQSTPSYTHYFRGFAGTLDHVFASPDMLCQVSGAAEWHINADFADLFDYNLDFDRPADYFDPSSPFRSSDHDPIIIGITPGQSCGAQE